MNSGRRQPPPSAARVARVPARGFALVVVLVVLMASTLAAAQLGRAVDILVGATGNLVLRDALLPEADRVLATAMAALADSGRVGNRENDVPESFYFASRQAEDARGIPFTLASSGSAPSPPSLATATNAVMPIRATWLIERLCIQPGAITSDNCLRVSQPASASPNTANSASATVTETGLPLYRITARLTGPGGGCVWAQVLVIGDSPPRRATWRLVTD